MARRKTGNPIDGWLVVDKPVGIGSTDIVSKARWALRARKAGHAGTLDPLASGLLAVAFGEATKTVPAVMEGEKRYRFTVRWGEATATDDREGEVIRRSDLRPDEAAIRAALPDLTGDILQIPPVYSAVKVDGARAYDLARAGEHPELTPRPLHVRGIDLVARDPDTATFDMTCGKGGYVRAIARDLGDALGCLGHVERLRRVAAGPFALEDGGGAPGFDPALFDAVRAGEITAPLLPVSAGLAQLPELQVSAAATAMLRNGNPVSAALDGLHFGAACWAAHGGEAVAVGELRAGQFHPRRVIAPPDPAFRVGCSRESG